MGKFDIVLNALIYVQYKRLLVLGFNLLMILTASGCFLTFRTAEVLPADTSEGGLSFTTTLSRWKVLAAGGQEVQSPPADLILPQLWYRRGLTDFLDIGFGTYGLGLAGDMRLGLIQDDFLIPAVALNAEGAVYFTGINGGGSAIISKNIGPATLFGGYKGIYMNILSSDNEFAPFGLYGPFGGLRWELTPNSALLLELDYFQNTGRDILTGEDGELRVGPGSTYLGEDGLVFGLAVTTRGLFE